MCSALFRGTLFPAVDQVHPLSGSGGEICVSHTSVCRQSIWGPPEALFLYWRQGKCLLGPKCQPPVHKNPAMAVLNGLAAKPFRHGRGCCISLKITNFACSYGKKKADICYPYAGGVPAGICRVRPSPASGNPHKRYPVRPVRPSSSASGAPEGV